MNGALRSIHTERLRYNRRNFDGQNGCQHILLVKKMKVPPPPPGQCYGDGDWVTRCEQTFRHIRDAVAWRLVKGPISPV